MKRLKELKKEFKLWVFVEFIFILFMMIVLEIQLTNAEMSLWTDTLIFPNTNIVRYHGFYVFDDTSVESGDLSNAVSGGILGGISAIINNIGKHKAIELRILATTQLLPFNVSVGIVDWCNYTITINKNLYSSDGNLVNTTKIVYNSYVIASLNNYTTIELYDKDSVAIDMDCHYTDLNGFYNDNTLIGEFTTFFPPFACKKCEKYTLEQLSQETARNENATIKQMTIYSGVQKLLGYNYNLWLYASWIIKIGFILVGVGLIFYGVYFIYKLVSDIARSSR